MESNNHFSKVGCKMADQIPFYNAFYSSYIEPFCLSSTVLKEISENEVS